MKEWKTGLKRLFVLMFTAALLSHSIDFTTLSVSAQTEEQAATITAVGEVAETVKEPINGIEDSNILVQVVNLDDASETGRALCFLPVVLISGLMILFSGIGAYAVFRKKKPEEQE